MDLKKLLGTAVPLSALRTEKCPVVGEFSALPIFGEFCKKSGVSLIQILPVNDSGTQSSPYSALSAFALHPLYITLSDIEEFDIVYTTDSDFKKHYDSFVKKHKNADRWNYQEVLTEKEYLLSKIYSWVAANKMTVKDGDAEAVEMAKNATDFFKKNPWIKSYCVFKVLKARYLQAGWTSWAKEEKNLTKKQIDDFFDSRTADFKSKESHPQVAPTVLNPYHDVKFYFWVQYRAFEQFERAVAELKKMKIMLKGDLPILLNKDSCDVWERRDLFNFSGEKMTLAAGSPPDGENPTGQNWGFPTYNWEAHEADGFAWWKMRLKVASEFYDAYRLDHILGFFRIWAIPDGEETAVLGHTEPCATISAAALEKEGFSKDRIKWLSVPHIPTLTDSSIMELFCDRIKDEELWNFKPEIKTDRDIDEITAKTKVVVPQNVISELKKWNKNRTLIEIKKNQFVPAWKRTESQSWQSLSDDEKEILDEIFEKIDKKQQKLWEEQASKILKALTSSVKMVPCAEDLGVPLEAMPKVLAENGILSLLVVRWCRDWWSEGQPYDDFSDYKENAVCTTSVHDTSTIRDWVETEFLENLQNIVEGKSLSPSLRRCFALECADKSANSLAHCAVSIPQSPKGATAPLKLPDVKPEKLIFNILKAAYGAKSKWFIPPIQDLLYVSKKYWKKDAKDERINIPGTVSDFNWTYRLPVTVEKLLADEKLSETISKISG